MDWTRRLLVSGGFIAGVLAFAFLAVILGLVVALGYHIHLILNLVGYT